MGRWWRREEIQESKGTKGPKVQGSHGPIYLKVTFKYELDSKEGPSCYFFFSNSGIVLNAFGSVLTITNWDVVGMFELITKGKKGQQNEKNRFHEPSLTKQLVYYTLILGGYLG